MLTGGPDSLRRDGYFALMRRGTGETLNESLARSKKKKGGKNKKGRRNMLTGGLGSFSNTEPVA